MSIYNFNIEKELKHNLSRCTEQARVNVELDLKIKNEHKKYEGYTKQQKDAHSSEHLFALYNLGAKKCVVQQNIIKYAKKVNQLKEIKKIIVKQNNNDTNNIDNNFLVMAIEITTCVRDYNRLKDEEIKNVKLLAQEAKKQIQYLYPRVLRFKNLQIMFDKYIKDNYSEEKNTDLLLKLKKNYYEDQEILATADKEAMNQLKAMKANRTDNLDDFYNEIERFINLSLVLDIKSGGDTRSEAEIKLAEDFEEIKTILTVYSKNKILELDKVRDDYLIQKEICEDICNDSERLNKVAESLKSGYLKEGISYLIKGEEELMESFFPQKPNYKTG